MATLTKNKKQTQIAQALKNLTTLFESDFHQDGEMLTFEDMSDASGYLTHFKGDLIAIEAFVNHIHLEDELRGLLNIQKDRSELMNIGRSLIKVWSERLKHDLGTRRIIFYLGGQDTVILRFHVEREDQKNWVNLSDKSFIKQEKLEIYEVTREGVMLVA